MTVMRKKETEKGGLRGDGDEGSWGTGCWVGYDTGGARFFLFFFGLFFYYLINFFLQNYEFAPKK